MNLLEKIQTKTKQLTLKTDEFIRNNGGITGASIGAACILSGVIGATAIAIASSPTLIGPGLLQDNVIANSISSFANFVNIDSGLTVMGVPLNLAGASLLLGGSSGLLFSAFSKVYNKISNKDVFYDQLTGYNEVNCVNNNDILVSIPALDFYEMVQKDTLKKSFKEVIGNIHIGNGVHETRIYPSSISLEEASFIQGETDIEKIKRLSFRETKDLEFASSLINKEASLNKISNLREKFTENTTKNKLSI